MNGDAAALGRARRRAGVCVLVAATALTLSAFGGRSAGAERAASATRAGATVDIKGSSPVWRDLLIKSVGTAGTTVRLAPNVDMDLTGLVDPIFFARGVVLTSEQPAAPIKKGGVRMPAGPPSPLPSPLQPILVPGRTPSSPGPRLYTTATRPSPLLEIQCNGTTLDGDNVRLFGFRLQGPHMNSMEGSQNEEKGIVVNGCKGVEIADMEISGFSGQGIYISDDAARMSSPSDVRIHDNYIHNNQHIGGEGYGVETSAGGWADIERNVFDLNRHAIASSGSVRQDAAGHVLAGTGYTANLNLVLRGGGYHGRWYKSTTHIFDVHGDDNCFPPGGSHTWNCGNAGTEYRYTNNAFQFTADNSIKIRGTPRKAVYIESNVFARPDLVDGVFKDGAVALRDDKNIHFGSGAQANRTGFDSYARYGVCDLDGDGKDDLFLPTGASWWYSSDARANWWYLFDAHETLDRVALGDFDGDGRCDVFTVAGDRWVISKSGKGEWTSLGTYGVPFDQLAFGQFLGDGKTDVFRRAPSGQWYAVTPGSNDWHALQSSSFPLSALRFGDFTGDGITDVLAVEGGHWSISRGATGSWETLNARLSDKLDNVRIADLDGNGIDDVIRFKFTGVTGSPVPTDASGEFDVSWDGRSDWKKFRSLTWPIQRIPPTVSYFTGRFDNARGRDILFLDDTRFGRLFTNASTSPMVQNVAPY